MAEATCTTCPRTKVTKKPMREQLGKFKNKGH